MEVTLIVRCLSKWEVLGVQLPNVLSSVTQCRSGLLPLTSLCWCMWFTTGPD